MLLHDVLVISEIPEAIDREGGKEIKYDRTMGAWLKGLI